MTKPREKLLLIAQDPTLSGDLCRYLETWDFEVTTHPDFASAIIALSLTEFQMAIIDADLPKTDCIAVAGNLKAADINFPLIFFAGPISIETIFDVLKHPKVLVLSKPFTESGFTQAMERISAMPVAADQILRSALRVDVQVPLVIEEHGPAHANNLSLTGMFIETEADIVQGSTLTLVLQLPKHPEVRIKANVARSIPGEGVGVSFIDVSQDALGAFRMLMFRELSHRLASDGEITSR